MPGRDKKYYLGVLLIIIVVFLTSIFIWLSYSYEVSRQAVSEKKMKQFSFPDSFILHTHSPAQMDSVIEKHSLIAPVYWEIINLQTRQLEAKSLKIFNKGEADSTILLLPNNRFIRFYFLISGGEILKNMKINLLLAFLLLGVLAMGVFFIFKAFKQLRLLADTRRDFFHNITHELKTPVSGILVTAELLKDYQVIEIPEKRDQLLQRILVEGKRLDDMVENIIHISSIDEVRPTLSLKPLLLSAMVDETIEKFQSRIEHNKTQIAHIKPVTECIVQGDENYIKNLLAILLDNALKYGKPDGEIILSYDAFDSVIRFSVENEGAPIPKKFRHRVFDKFFRIPGTQSIEVRGHGLGLYYARKIIELHDGKIEYFPSAKGSRFCLQFPNNHAYA